MFGGGEFEEWPVTSGLQNYGRMMQNLNSLFRLFEETGGAQEYMEESGARWLPNMDIVEDTNERVVRIDLPGLKLEDITLELHRNKLWVSGNKQEEKLDSSTKYTRRERPTGPFRRRITIPEGTTEKDIVTHFKNGVLEIRFPLPKRVGGVKIPIAGEKPVQQVLEKGVQKEGLEKEEQLKEEQYKEEVPIKEQGKKIPITTSGEYQYVHAGEHKEETFKKIPITSPEEFATEHKRGEYKKFESEMIPRRPEESL